MHNNYRTSVPAVCGVLGSMLAARTVLASSPPSPGDLVIVEANDTQIYRYQAGSGLLSALATARAPATASPPFQKASNFPVIVHRLSLFME